MKEPKPYSSNELELDLWRVKVGGLVFFGVAVISLVLLIVVFAVGMRASEISIIKAEDKVPAFVDVGFIVADNTWVWQNPQENSPRVFNLVRGTSVLILKREGDWYQIWIQGQSGWVKDNVIITKAEREKQMSVISPEITDLKQTIDEVGNLVVTGKVVNQSDAPIKNIKIRIDVYDSNDNLSDQATVYVATDKPLLKNNPKPFSYVFPNKTSDYEVEAFIESWQ